MQVLRSGILGAVQRNRYIEMDAAPFCYNRANFLNIYIYIYIYNRHSAQVVRMSL